jgi:hypothetical protein
LLSKNTDHLVSLLSIGGTVPEGPGIYLHILGSRPYLYVGQSIGTTGRLKDHNNPKFRREHPALHYFAWEKLGPEVESAWVMLSTPNLESIEDRRMLNLQEMADSVLLQTLSKELLSRYLPGTMLSPLAGCHLQIQSPLAQTNSTESPQEQRVNIHQSSDPLVQEYSEDYQRQYRLLRNSTDPLLSGYWWENQKKQVRHQGYSSSGNTH